VPEALADPTRRAVWERLTRESMTVGELAADPRRDGLAALREYLDTMWRDGLESYAAAINRQNQEKESSSA
jgi:hypothetical protein